MSKDDSSNDSGDLEEPNGGENIYVNAQTSLSHEVIAHQVRNGPHGCIRGLPFCSWEVLLNVLSISTVAKARELDSKEGKLSSFANVHIAELRAL